MYDDNKTIIVIIVCVIIMIIGINLIKMLQKRQEREEKQLQYKKSAMSEYFSIDLCLRTGDFYFDDFCFDDVIMSMLYVHRIKKRVYIDNNWVDELFEIVFDGKYENDKLIRLLIVNPNIINNKRNKNTKYDTDVEILINDKRVIEKLKKQLEKLKKNHPKFYTQRYELAEKLLNCKDEHESRRLIARYNNDNVVDFYKDADFNFSDYEIKRVTEHKYKFINIKGKTIVDNIYVKFEGNIQFANQLNKLECFKGTHYFQVPEKGIDLCHYKNEIDKIQEGVYEVWYNEISTFKSSLYDDKYNILIGYYVRCDVDFDVNEWLEKQKEELGYDVSKVNKLDE